MIVEHPHKLAAWVFSSEASTSFVCLFLSWAESIGWALRVVGSSVLAPFRGEPLPERP